MMGFSSINRENVMREREDIVEVMVTHWSFDDLSQCYNAAELMRLLSAEEKEKREEKPLPAVLVGDFNIYVDFEW